jgi:hypothetical protein
MPYVLSAPRVNPPLWPSAARKLGLPEICIIILGSAILVIFLGDCRPALCHIARLHRRQDHRRQGPRVSLAGQGCRPVPQDRQGAPAEGGWRRHAEVDALLAWAAKLGIFGTRERSTIRLASKTGIAAIAATVRGRHASPAARVDPNHGAESADQEPDQGGGRDHPAR